MPDPVLSGAAAYVASDTTSWVDLVFAATPAFGAVQEGSARLIASDT